jgi:hypothetical protein
VLLRFRDFLDGLRGLVLSEGENDRGSEEVPSWTVLRIRMKRVFWKKTLQSKTSFRVSSPSGIDECWICNSAYCCQYIAEMGPGGEVT